MSGICLRAGLCQLPMILLFLFGILNFAAGKATLESGHPIVDTMPELMKRHGGRFPLIFEFTLLLAAMLLFANGWQPVVWLYGAYTAINTLFCWLLLNNRI